MLRLAIARLAPRGAISPSGPRFSPLYRISSPKRGIFKDTFHIAEYFGWQSFKGVGPVAFIMINFLAIGYILNRQPMDNADYRVNKVENLIV